MQGEVSRPIVSYSYDLEKITPYSYSVYLDEADIQVEYAPSHQAGIYHISFGTEGDNALVVNTKNGKLVAEEKRESVAIRLLTTLLPKIYLYLETSQPPLRKGVLADGKVDIESKEGSAIALFYGSEKNLNLRYGISFYQCRAGKEESAT